MEYIAAKSISTYPLVMDRGTGKASRDGDPNADGLFAAVYPNRAILAIADGCNWGIRSQKAAHRALEGVSQYLLAHEEQVRPKKKKKNPPDVPDRLNPRWTT